ncbi:uncharacterized protein LOC100182765 [Ciona intestinalis]
MIQKSSQKNARISSKREVPATDSDSSDSDRTTVPSEYEETCMKSMDRSEPSKIEMNMSDLNAIKKEILDAKRFYERQIFAEKLAAPVSRTNSPRPRFKPVPPKSKMYCNTSESETDASTASIVRRYRQYRKAERTQKCSVGVQVGQSLESQVGTQTQTSNAVTLRAPSQVVVASPQRTGPTLVASRTAEASTQYPEPAALTPARWVEPVAVCCKPNHPFPSNHLNPLDNAGDRPINPTVNQNCAGQTCNCQGPDYAALLAELVVDVNDLKLDRNRSVETSHSTKLDHRNTHHENRSSCRRDAWHSDDSSPSRNDNVHPEARRNSRRDTRHYDRSSSKRDVRYPEDRFPNRRDTMHPEVRGNSRRDTRHYGDGSLCTINIGYPEDKSSSRRDTWHYEGRSPDRRDIMHPEARGCSRRDTWHPEARSSSRRDIVHPVIRNNISRDTVYSVDSSSSSNTFSSQSIFNQTTENAFERLKKRFKTEFQKTAVGFVKQEAVREELSSH